MPCQICTYVRAHDNMSESMVMYYRLGCICVLITKVSAERTIICVAFALRTRSSFWFSKFRFFLARTVGLVFLSGVGASPWEELRLGTEDLLEEDDMILTTLLQYITL